MQNGHPIAYVSRTLSETETRYAQIEKEMLAIVYAVEKFNNYTFGRKVTVYSDHKPLESILKKPLHRAPKRLRGMMIRLQKYDIEVKYEKGNNMFFANTLATASIPDDGKSGPEFETINMMKYLPISDERLKEIQRETKSDESLQVLTTVIRQGWPEQKEDLPNVVTPYFNIRDEMSIQDGLVFRGERVVIPQAMRSKMLGKVHNSHLGVNGCLNRARECLYWPGMSNNIKNHVSTCEACLEYERSQPKKTLCSHEVPSRPWQRVGIDLFELERKHYLVTADYFSDFFELDHLKNISSVHVIRKIKSHFARHGIPEQVITDNGPQFVAHDFQIFTKEWDFEHITCSPYHSQANGKAESAVKEAKKILRKSKKAKSDAFLVVLDHRNTPSASMKSSPAQRLLNRRARTLLPTTAKLLQPQSIDSSTTVEKLAERKRQQAKYYNRGAVELNPLDEEDVVRIKPFRLGRKEWEKSVVQKRLDQRSYEIETPHAILRRNRVQLRKTNEASPDIEQRSAMDNSIPLDMGGSGEQMSPSKEMGTTEARTEMTYLPAAEDNGAVRRSGRARKPPSYLKDFVLK
ncbi:Transposon Ty3-G Gag-Pol poly [Paramuricea clavata]|uniref:Transposon Ty3-G Gag-Pol poly n=1 Tax=Paramuricea clavata TaxID=317549 RepID=A0A6S7HP31_PARCT|nr:Transposon Ty3-G Gag-Pol poly [Paramuricea clavata]